MAIYIYKNNEQLGPFEDAVVLSTLLDGTFDFSDLCWREGWEDWKPLESIFPRPINKQNDDHNACEKPIRENQKIKRPLFGVIIRIFKSLLGDREFSNYDECPKIFYRFDRGEEYGPRQIHGYIDNLPGYSKNSLKECRFADEKKWHPTEYFIELYDKLPAGESATTKLKKLKISFDGNISHKEALKLIEDTDSKLAPTKSMLKKLNEHGVSTESVTTKEEALKLFDEVKKKEALMRDAERIVAQRLEDAPLFQEQLLRLEEIKNKTLLILPGWKPKAFDQINSDLSDLESYIELLEEALDCAMTWDAESFLKYPFLEMKTSKDGYCDEIEYKLSFANNVVPKDGVTAFQGMVFKAYIKAESDEFSRLSLALAAIVNSFRAHALASICRHGCR